MKKFDPKSFIGYIIIILFTISGNLYCQSSSFGNTFIFNNVEMAVHDVQHNFLNGGSGIQPGIVGTDRIVNQGFMSFVGTASCTGASNTAFVDGYVKTYTTSAFTFPIGDNDRYRPAAISTASLANPSDAAYYGVSATTAITSRLGGGNESVLPVSGPFNTALKGAGVNFVDNSEYWDINGATSAKITLTWDATSAITSLTSLSILGWNGTQWVAIASSVDTTSLLGGSSSLTSGSITTNGAIIPNNYEVYTLGIIGTDFTPTIEIDNVVFLTPGVTRDFVVNISEIESSSSIGQVIFKIYKQSAFGITYNPVISSSDVNGGTVVNNSDWLVTEDSLFITATLKPGIIINANTFSTVGFTITRNPLTPSQTWQSITATIVTGSGGDFLGQNNTYNILVKAQ
jgi:hypothetical protein